MRVFAALVGLAGAACAIAVPAPRGAAAASSPPPAVSVNADNITFDNRGTTLLATGHVAVAYGRLRATSEALRIDRPTGTATLTGGVSIADERGKASARVATLVVQRESRVTQVVLAGQAAVETSSYAVLADRIVADRTLNRLTAAGHVTIFSKPDLIVTGAFASYDEGAQHAVVRGDARTRATVQNRDGRLRGATIDVSRKAGLALVHGPVEAEIYDATLTGAEATIDLNRATAVVRGHVIVSRRRGTLVADQLTVYYRARRFLAEGATGMTFLDLEDSSFP